jgi:hypothetical protein
MMWIEALSNQEFLLPLAVVPAASSWIARTIGAARTGVACEAAEFQSR